MLEGNYNSETGILSITDGEKTLLSIQGQTATRIGDILSTNGSFLGLTNCNIITLYIKSGKIYYQSPDTASKNVKKIVEDMSIEEAVENFDFPLTCGIKGNGGVLLHSCTIIGKKEKEYICFHQDGMRGKIGFQTLTIINDSQIGNYYAFAPCK